VQNAQVRVHWKQDRQDDTARFESQARRSRGRYTGEIKFVDKLWAEHRLFIPSRSGVAQVDAQRVLDLPIVDAHQSDLIDHCNKSTCHVLARSSSHGRQYSPDGEDRPSIHTISCHDIVQLEFETKTPSPNHDPRDTKNESAVCAHPRHHRHSNHAYQKTRISFRLMTIRVSMIMRRCENGGLLMEPLPFSLRTARLRI
jgi:hypothetical protein